MEIKQTLSVDEIDLSDPEFWVRPIEEREGAFAVLRAENPVPFTKERDIPELPLPTGPGYWSLTRHADILEASRNPEIYCSGKGVTSIPDLPPEFNEFFGGLINMDEPRHGHQRRIVSRGFTPRALARLEADVQRRADAVIDRVIERGECDFVTDIAAPLPLEIICDMMGIPESQHQMVFERTNIILGLGDPEFGDGSVVTTRDSMVVRWQPRGLFIRHADEAGVLQPRASASQSPRVSPSMYSITM